jgi:hypothetical protein
MVSLGFCFGGIDVNREMGIRQNGLILIISVVERSRVGIANSLDIKGSWRLSLVEVIIDKIPVFR